MPGAVRFVEGGAAVKAGYKKTEVGVIPEEWVTLPIQGFAKIGSGTTPPRALHDKYFANGIIPWVKTLDLDNGGISSTEEMVTLDALKDTSLKLYPVGTVLVAMYGGFNQIGRTGILRTEAAINQALASIQVDRGFVDPDYLLMILNFRVDAWKSVASSSRKDPNITSRDVKDFVVAVPNLQEQKNIASALSDADELIESLEQLLAKKRNLKQGAMQELLTGKRRLAGFDLPWGKRRLGDICSISMGRTPSRLISAYWGSGYKWLSISDLKSKIVKESKEEITSLGAEGMQIIPEGTLLMSFKLSIGQLCFAGCDLYTNEAICSFNNPKANKNYLYYALGRVDFSTYGKQAVKGFTLNKQSLNSVEVPFPPIEEQTAIAAILSDMDADITALENQLAKARQIKQGMMQELLTGRIRLV